MMNAKDKLLLAMHKIADLGTCGGNGGLQKAIDIAVAAIDEHDAAPAAPAPEPDTIIVRVEDTCDGLLINAEDFKRFGLTPDRQYEGKFLPDGRYQIVRTPEPPPAPVAADYVLPCDVMIAPGTIIRKGCKLSTLLAGIKGRETAPEGTCLTLTRPAPVAASAVDARSMEILQDALTSALAGVPGWKDEAKAALKHLAATPPSPNPVADNPAASMRNVAASPLFNIQSIGRAKRLPCPVNVVPVFDACPRWIEWKGGECPVNDPDKLVEVETMDGRLFLEAAKSLRWQHMSEAGRPLRDNIIRYREVF